MERAMELFVVPKSMPTALPAITYSIRRDTILVRVRLPREMRGLTFGKPAATCVCKSADTARMSACATFALWSWIALTPCAIAQTSVSEKWNLFESETFAPMTLGAAAFNAAVSQATNSTPLYGRQMWPGYPERFGSA